MLQCAGTALRTGLQRRVLAACSCRSQFGRAGLTQGVLKELPAASMHADADVATVTINSAEMMLLRVKVQATLLQNRKITVAINGVVSKRFTPFLGQMSDMEMLRQQPHTSTNLCSQRSR